MRQEGNLNYPYTDAYNSARIWNDMHYPPLTVSTGPAHAEVDVLGEGLQIHTYSPSGVAVGGILFLFDGIYRNAAGIRDKAISVSDRYGLILIAPQMDRAKFPKWRYHFAGVIGEHGLRHPDDWTGKFIQILIEQILRRIGREITQVCVFGHSAGAQLISRVCAYSPLLSVDEVIVANPSSYVMPTIDEPAPFGFKGIVSRRQAMSMLKDYLATPMTIYLGMDDTQDLYLSHSKYPMRQGRNRLERGQNLYRLGLQMAQFYGFNFNWRLVEIPGVGHSSREMLECDNFGKALRKRHFENQRNG